MTRWFHCIRISPDVLDEDHPFHELFAGNGPPHLFVASRDGSNRHDLDGQQSRTELWQTMESALASEYEPGHESALKELTKLLDRFDALDQRTEELEQALDREIESRGPDGAKVSRLRKELAGIEQERAHLRERAAELSSLRFRIEEPGAKPHAR